MKNNSISIRLTDKELNILNSYKDHYHMNNTQVISFLLNNNIPQTQHQQEIAGTVCRIYIRLHELGLADDTITKEVQKLCQILS